MSNIPVQIDSAIREFLYNISKKIPIDKAILFGSYAKGNFTEDSDMDLINPEGIVKEIIKTGIEIKM